MNESVECITDCEWVDYESDCEDTNGRASAKFLHSSSSLCLTGSNLNSEHDALRNNISNGERLDRSVNGEVGC